MSVVGRRLPATMSKFLAHVLVCGLGEVIFAGDPTSLACDNMLILIHITVAPECQYIGPDMSLSYCRVSHGCYEYSILILFLVLHHAHPLHQSILHFKSPSLHSHKIPTTQQGKHCYLSILSNPCSDQEKCQTVTLSRRFDN